MQGINTDDLQTVSPVLFLVIRTESSWRYVTPPGLLVAGWTQYIFSKLSTSTKLPSSVIAAKEFTVAAENSGCLNYTCTG